MQTSKYYYLPFQLPTLSPRPCCNKESSGVWLKYAKGYTLRNSIRIQLAVGGPLLVWISLISQPGCSPSCKELLPPWISFSLWRLARHLRPHDAHLLCAHCPTRPLKSPRIPTYFAAAAPLEGEGCKNRWLIQGMPRTTGMLNAITGCTPSLCRNWSYSARVTSFSREPRSYTLLLTRRQNGLIKWNTVLRAFFFSKACKFLVRKPLFSSRRDRSITDTVHHDPWRKRGNETGQEWNPNDREISN